MAAGKTILASDLPSLRRYLTSDNAAFFRPSDVVSLTENLKRLLDDQTYAQSLGVTALYDATTHTWESRAKKIIHAIDI